MDSEDLFKKAGKTRIDVSILRGLVITHAVDIEAYVGAIITNYFVMSNKHSEFSTMALSDPYFSFGMKLSIFKRILNKIELEPYEGFKEDLRRINELRNRFAHSMLFGFDGDLIYPAGEKPMKTKNAKKMYDEYIQLYGKVFKELEKIFWHIIGKPNPFENKQKEDSVDKV